MQAQPDSSSNKNKSKPEDRRDSFRIDDSISLKVQPINKADLTERLENFWQHRDAFSLLNAFSVSDEQLLPQRAVIEKQYPQIADYLRTLEQKMESLAKIMILQNSEMPSEPTHSVNLSATGMRFFSPKAVNVHDYLEIKMQLYPSMNRLMTIGRIVWVVDMRQQLHEALLKQGQQNRFLGSHQGRLQEAFAIGVDFENMHDEDRELLYRHIHHQQMQNLSR